MSRRSITEYVRPRDLDEAWQRLAAGEGSVRVLSGGTDLTISAVFVIGSVMAAIAGMLVTLTYGSFDFYVGFIIGIKAFTAAVLGGIGSLPGAMLGGLIIGMIETFWSAYFTIEYKDVAAFSILAVVLIFLPSGILGRPEVEKV